MLNRITICQQLSSWIDDHHRNGILPLKLFSDDPAFHLGFARIARKTSNLRLAHHQLSLFFAKNRKAYHNDAVFLVISKMLNFSIKFFFLN